MTRLTGIVPPVQTPLTEGGELDVAAYRRHLDRLIDAGVAGLFVLGSTSEVVFLTDRQRHDVLSAAVEHVAGRVPVLAGAIDTATARVIEHVKAADEIGVDGIVTTAPFYARVSEPEIENHFRAVHAATSTPLWAYDIPVCVNNKLSLDLLLRLARDGVITGVKDSSGDDVALRKLVLTARADSRYDGLSILTGSELLVDSALAFGVDGVVPGLGNVDPAGYVRLYNLAKAGKWDEARAEQERLFRLFDFVSVGAASGRMGTNSSAMGAFKAGLALQGVFANNVTAAPQVQLNDAELDDIRGYLQRAGLVPVA